MTETITEQTVKRSLRCDLSSKEIHDYSIHLANKNKELVAIEEEKKAVMSQFKARIDETQATVNRLSNVVTDGFEMREIECEVQYHKPAQGKKTIIRKDTDKVTSIESMEQWDYTLFNQPEDEETTSLLDAERDKLKGKGSNGSRKRRGLE